MENFISNSGGSNIGEIDVRIDVSLEKNGVIREVRSETRSVPIGNSELYRFEYIQPISVEGMYTLVFTIDPEHKIKETNEENNESGRLLFSR